MRRGAPNPDVGSVEAFWRALLEAKLVAYIREGPSGVYLIGLLQRLIGLLQRLGIADEVRAKATTARPSWVS